MLYIIGGAARAGKTMLARRLLQERNIPCFCVDWIVGALERAYDYLSLPDQGAYRQNSPVGFPVSS
jgi:hypothetical protein